MVWHFIRTFFPRHQIIEIRLFYPNRMRKMTLYTQNRHVDDIKETSKKPFVLVLTTFIGASLKWFGGVVGAIGAYIFWFHDSRDPEGAILGFIVAIFGVILQYLPMGVAALLEIGTSIDSIDQSLKQNRQQHD